MLFKYNFMGIHRDTHLARACIHAIVLLKYAHVVFFRLVSISSALRTLVRPDDLPAPKRHSARDRGKDSVGATQLMQIIIIVISHPLGSIQRASTCLLHLLCAMRS